ncbi:MAG TPA: non-ribosomal peptide synthetase module [Bacillota bacterium]|nr:non-ribosomal peptide synthetase module [Bacillota bacterium]
MAQRLATEYKQIILELTSQQLQEFIDFFKGKKYLTEVRVCENGDTEFILLDDGKEIPLAFHSNGLLFQFEGSYMISDLQLAQLMRQIIKEFKGTATVHRVYNHYVMEYDYEYGNVKRILERKDGAVTLIYEYQDTAGSLTRLFEQQGVEDQITWVKLQIDMLLEHRAKTSSKAGIEGIDIQLNELTRELFALEA